MNFIGFQANWKLNFLTSPKLHFYRWPTELPVKLSKHTLYVCAGVSATVSLCDSTPSSPDEIMSVLKLNDVDLPLLAIKTLCQCWEAQAY